jgi:hypothetical protein
MVYRFATSSPLLQRQIAGVVYLVSMPVLFIVCGLKLEGLLTIVQLVPASLSVVILADYRSERGTWMLARLFFVCFGLFFGLMILGEGRDILRGARPAATSTLIDAAISTVILKCHLEYLWIIGTLNWNWFTRPEAEGEYAE